MRNNPYQQPYDGTLKGLFGKQAALIIPYLFPMIRLEATPLEAEDEPGEEAGAKEKAEKKTGAELNIEINRSTLKADLLYRAFYNLRNIILVMERTQTISEEEKHIIKEVLQVQYQIDPLIRENSTVVAIAAEAEAKGEIKGELKGLRKAILAVVSNRFPALVISQIQQTITSSQDVEQLQKFLCQVAQMSDEQEVSALLTQCFPYQDEIDPLITENPTIRAMVAEGEAKGIRNSILDFVSVRFSSVAAQVQQTIAPIQDAQLLRKFNRQLVRVSDEQEVYALLAQHFPTYK
ncbi:MAG TPA: hypothetical protein VN207_00115 [Ktedonobacteraceae bacterium]|nr:hypothetical protein [Ktedonobacteraceae bacterium]